MTLGNRTAFFLCLAWAVVWFLILVLAPAALAAEGSVVDSPWASVGTILGVVLTGAATSAGTSWMAYKKGLNTPAPTIAGIPDPTVLGLLNQVLSRMDLMAKRQHKANNALLIVLLRQPMTPEEQKALKVLADDSDEDEPEKKP